MAYSYTEYEWKDAPDHKTTPLSATNFNHMEKGIGDAYKFDNTGTNLSSTTVDGAIKEVNGKFGGVMSMSLLWTNPSPNASFSAQQVILSSGDYDFMYYYFRETTSGGCKGALVPKGKSAVLDLADLGSSGNTSRKRIASYVDATHINFSNGMVGSSSSYAENASVIIPQAIYGIKLI